jgi:hypothetical protein
MVYETEWKNSGNIHVKDIVFTNRNVYSIAFVDGEKIRVFFKQQSAKKDSNQMCEYTHICNGSGEVRNQYPTPIMLRIVFPALYLTLP